MSRGEDLDPLQSEEVRERVRVVEKLNWVLTRVKWERREKERNGVK
jgi:hypothetical protein